MKGHERDPRWSRRRRDTCILWSLGVGALVTLLWLTVFMTLLLTTGDQVFRRRYPRLAPHPFALSKPPTVIAEPFTPPVLNHVPSTRTQGNRFAVVTRALCGRKTSKELVADYGSDGYL